MDDFNCPNLNKSATIRPFFEHHFKRLIDSHPPYNHGKVATRFDNLQSPSILDLVLTNEELMVEFVNVTSPLGHSDHAVLTFKYVCYASIQGSDSAPDARWFAVLELSCVSAKHSFIDWIPVSSRLCTVRLNSSVRVTSYRSRRRCLFIVSVNVLTDHNAPEIKDVFYNDLSQLLQSAQSTDIVVHDRDSNTQVGSLEEAHQLLPKANKPHCFIIANIFRAMDSNRPHRQLVETDYALLRARFSLRLVIKRHRATGCL
ncbi:unnamed protein product [Echinostoma caproni]|uniref:Endo/exonuclease/phosphatase domain-containing protein n=1 Tax=Echinostoma caproni TaxID=27848 RepID=A0A183AUK7_9TREM|nr:unnamed protein product [Echinostoma caproni]